MSYDYGRYPRFPRAKEAGLDQARLAQVHVDAIDSVPALWIDGPPPFTIFLIFRVGRADEHLANSGITHLIEHLAFPHDHVNQVGHNGTTDLTRTMFFAWGDAAEAAEFINGVSRTLAQPPVQRIDAQRSIILTEEARGGGGPRTELLLARYGARAHGVVGFKQLGLHSLGAPDLLHWAGRYFTSENAVLCLTGSPPSRLALELPPGSRFPAPQGTPLDGPLPRWSTAAQSSVALGVVTGHDAASGMATRIIERRLYKRLRHHMAMSYAVESGGDLIDPQTLHRVIVADCLEEAAPTVTRTVMDLADEFAARGPSEEELQDDLAQLERQLRDDPRAIAGWMMYAADCYLNGIDVEELEDYIALRRFVTRADVRDAWQQAMSTSILLVPPSVDVHDTSFGSLRFPAPVRGRTFHPPGIGRFRDGVRAVLGKDGLSLIASAASSATVLFDQCVAVVRVPPRERTLIARDGSSLTVDGARYASGDELIAGIDAALPRDYWIDLPAPP